MMFVDLVAEVLEMSSGKHFMHSLNLGINSYETRKCFPSILC